MTTNSMRNHLDNFIEVYEYHKTHNYIVINLYLNYFVAVLTNIVVAFTFYVIRKYGQSLDIFYRYFSYTYLMNKYRILITYSEEA